MPAFAQDAPTPETEIVRLEGALNTRDIGGYSAANGKHIVRGRIFRSSELSYLTDADVRKLKSLNVQTVVDFRSPKEAAAAPDRLPAGAHYVNSPIIADKLDMRKVQTILVRDHLPSAMFNVDAVDAHGPYYRMLTLVNSYDDPNDIRQLGPGYKPLFAQLLALPNGEAILYHCTGGRDRTGLGTALLMAALGAPEKDIEQNFLQSNANLQPERDNPDSLAFERFRFSSVYLQPATNHEYQRVAMQFNSTPQVLYDAVKLKPQYIHTLFTTIEKQYGSMDSFFDTELGLDREKLALLRAKFTE